MESNNRISYFFKRISTYLRALYISCKKQPSDWLCKSNNYIMATFGINPLEWWLAYLFLSPKERKKKSSLTLFFPMFLFDPSENIRKANISYPLIRSSTRAYQGVRTVSFSDVFRGDQKRILGKRRANIFITPPCNPSKETADQIDGGTNSRDFRLSGRTDILWILLKVAH